MNLVLDWIYRIFAVCVYIRDDYFRFGSVFIKKTKPIKKTETKPVQTGLAWFFSSLGSVLGL